MKFEIDVSGCDIFSENYVICIAGENNTVRGFKFNKELTKTIIDKWQNKEYGYMDMVMMKEKELFLK